MWPPTEDVTAHHVAPVDCADGLAMARAVPAPAEVSVGVTRRDAVILGSAAGTLITGWFLPNASAAASPSDERSDSEDIGAIRTTQVTVEGTLYDLYAFTDTSTSTTVDVGTSWFDLLIVGGGGSGGEFFVRDAAPRIYGGGGGGGGEVVTARVQAPGTYVITVGPGGRPSFSRGANGSASRIDALSSGDGGSTSLVLEAQGGGGGSGGDLAALAARSSGGGSTTQAPGGPLAATTPFVAVTALVSAAGAGGAGAGASGGGGGGAGSGGVAGSEGDGGGGGTPGDLTAWFGVGWDDAAVRGLLGAGGGGAGLTAAGGGGSGGGSGALLGTSGSSSSPGTAGTGGGGGGGGQVVTPEGDSLRFGAAGGSGVVYLRVPVID